MGRKIFISCQNFIRGRNRQKQPKRSRGRGLLFASLLRRKTGHRNQENFCTAYAGRNGFPLKRAAGTQIEVSPICGSRRLHRICVPAPVLQRHCPAHPRFAQGRGTVSRSRRLMQLSRFGYEELQAGRPAANSLEKIKKTAPQGTKGFCRGTSGGKMVRCGCGTAVYCAKVADAMLILT